MALNSATYPGACMAPLDPHHQPGTTHRLGRTWVRVTGRTLQMLASLPELNGTAPDRLNHMPWELQSCGARLSHPQRRLYDLS